MKNKEIEELLNDIKTHDYEVLNREDYSLLLSRIEQLEKEVEEYEYLIKMQNNREYRSKFLKEFQEEHGKNVFPDYDEIYKRYDKLKKQKDDVVEYVKNNFIEGEVFYSKSWLKMKKKELLRMLGERDD